MRFIDHSFALPAENLAFEEILLDRVEQGLAPETLRCWESPARFVVLGTAQENQREVYLDHCEADGVPILRRCSAGGCVLQGPGCLNFTLILDFAGRPEIRSVRASYEYLLTRISAGCRARGLEAHREGISDLAIGGVKVSGNAQRRRRRAMLHHGTLLYQPDYEGMTRYLREPDDRPEYRGARDHRAFVGAFTLGPDELRAIILEAFNIEGPSSVPTPDELAAVHALAHEKYGNPAWTYRR